MIAFFPRKKNNVNFFSKIDNDNLITKNNNAFFFSKTKTYFAQKRIKTISNKKIENKINAFSKKKRRRYKKFTYFEKNENHFTISNQFTISRKNSFRTCCHASINYHDLNFLVDFNHKILKKFIRFCRVYKKFSQIQFSKIYYQTIFAFYCEIHEKHEKNESSYQYIFSFSSSSSKFSKIFSFVFISNNLNSMNRQFFDFFSRTF